MKAVTLAMLVGLALACGCSNSPQVASASSDPNGPSLNGPQGPSPLETPTPTGSLTAIAYPSPTPAPAGTPVQRQVLSPATVMPAISLCSVPLQVYQDGNAGPLFCSNGLNVEVWKYFAPADPHVLGVGPAASLKDVEAAICADGSVNHATLPMEESGYLLARAYYGWTFSFDYWMFQQTGTCP